MGKKAQAKKRARPRMGFMMKTVILVLLVAIGWQLYQLQGQLETAQADKTRYEELVAKQQQENDALKADIAEGPTAEKMEQIARDALGYVKPGEYIFDPSH